MEFVSLALEKYEKFKNAGDPRTQGYIGAHTPWMVLISIAIYLILVMHLIPKYMKTRKPFCLKELMIVYNFSQCFFNAWLFYKLGMNGWFGTYSLRCAPNDLSTSPKVMEAVVLTWFYWANKLVELFDTVIFALRKKQNQITFLHVYHHASMLINVWFSVKFVPVGQIQFSGFLNCFIHTVMYFYYGMSAFGPQMAKYLWWKKYITKLQVIQLSMCVVHGVQIFIWECNYPKWMIGIVMAQASFYVVLFLNYYYNHYNNKVKTSQMKSTNGHLKLP